MMSPWLTATQTAPGPCSASTAASWRRTADTARACIARHRLAAGERGRGRLGLHRRPELLLGEVAQRPALPLAVVALGDPAVGARSSSGPPCAPRIACAVCRQRSRGLLTIAASGTTAEPLARSRVAWPCPVSSSCTPASRPASTPVAFAVVRPWRTRITVAMSASVVGLASARDRRQRAVPQGRPGPGRLLAPRARTSSAAKATDDGDFVWVGLHEPSEARARGRRDRLRPAPPGRRGRPARPPAAEAGALRRQPVPRPQDALVRRRAGRRRDRRDQHLRGRGLHRDRAPRRRAPSCTRPAATSSPARPCSRTARRRWCTPCATASWTAT